MITYANYYMESCQRVSSPGIGGRKNGEVRQRIEIFL